MNPHPTHAPHTRPSRRILAGFLAFTGAVGFAVADTYTPTGEAIREPAGEPAPPPPAAAVAEQPRVPDVVIARAALAALDGERELRGVNLVVSVVDRVAVIGGPVAGARQAKRAEELVRGIPGVADVRNTCFVSQGPDPLLSAVTDRLGSSLPPRPTMFELPGVLTGTPHVSFPVPTGDAGMTAAADGPNTVVARKPATDPGVLGGPVSPAAPGAAAPTPPPAPTPVTLTGNRADVRATIDAARKAEPRFSRLTVESRDGALVIGGAAPLVSDAWDYADKLRGIPGVSRVVVGDVAGK